MKNKSLVIFFSLMGFLCGKNASAETLTITNDAGRQIELNVEIADNPSLRAKGLMFRREMPEVSGMIFIFSDVLRPSFWMKNTLIPLDMLFLDENGSVVDLHKMAKPLDLTLITPSQPVKAVLEINGGMSEKWEIGLKSKISSDFLSKSLE